MQAKIALDLIDCSDSEKFCFGVYCEECNTLYKSREVMFSRAGVIPGSEEKKLVLQILYEKEKTIAKQRALKTFKEKFNVCPVCNRKVCDKCFLICEELDMCTSCAKKLKECGERVDT